MKNNKGLTLVSLVVTIIVLLILAGVSLNMLIGDNGVLTKATTVEVSYNKGEVIEELNILSTEKYLEAYNEAVSAGDVMNISQYYNPTTVINFLLGKDKDGNTVPGAKVYIEPLNGEYDKSKNDTRYFIIVSSLGRNIEKYGLGTNNVNNTDYFYIKTTEDDSGKILTTTVFYKDADPATEDEKIGDIVYTQSL